LAYNYYTSVEKAVKVKKNAFLATIFTCQRTK
jgi:hypothetical protein